MSLLTMAQHIANEAKRPKITSVIGSTDSNARQIHAFIRRAGIWMREHYKWAQLTKLHTITTVADQEAYALPTDLDKQNWATHWNETNFWELRGPMTGQQWRYRQAGISEVIPRKEYRVMGWKANQFHLFPIPSAVETISFEYQTKTWVKPRTWATGESFDTGEHCSYEENIYSAVVGGVAGATAPTHTTGSASDDNITWAYRSAAYEDFLTDSEESLIDEEVIIMEALWRMFKVDGLAWKNEQAEARSMAAVLVSAQTSAPILSLVRSKRSGFLTTDSIPDGNWGT